jgi:hypothetical protein
MNTMANEQEPDHALPVDYVPDGAVAAHRVGNAKTGLRSPDCMTWASIDLIYFNFHRTVPRRSTGISIGDHVYQHDE